MMMWNQEGAMEAYAYIGGAWYISPLNLFNADSTASLVTCLQGATRTRLPSLS